MFLEQVSLHSADAGAPNKDQNRIEPPDSSRGSTVKPFGHDSATLPTKSPKLLATKAFALLGLNQWVPGSSPGGARRTSYFSRELRYLRYWTYPHSDQVSNFSSDLLNRSLLC